MQSMYNSIKGDAKIWIKGECGMEKYHVDFRYILRGGQWKIHFLRSPKGGIAHEKIIDRPLFLFYNL
jgi:hypothetical protein